MAEVHWTGHPFVDAGLAAVAATAQVERLEALTPEHLQRAFEELKRVLLSDQALGVGVEKAFVRGALSQLFPNSELVNPSNWKGQTPEDKLASVREKFREAFAEDLKRAKQCVGSDSGGEVCCACGEWRPNDAMRTMRKDKLPLLEGIVNFYPAFAYGVRICGLCALAVRFLPMSVMRTGVYNRLWFLHTQTLEIGATVSQTYGWRHFNDAIAANKTLDFFSAWETAGDAGTVLYLLCELLDRFGDQVRTAYQSPLPITAYTFSNDNRGSFVQALPVPHELMGFLARLHIRSDRAFQRFRHELLQVPSNLADKERKARAGFVQSIARRMLDGSALIDNCLDHDTPKIQGGWTGHRLYLQEVVGMANTKLAILERLGITMAQSDEAKRLINELRSAQRNELYGVLLSYVRRGWLTHEEFYALLPPNSYGAAGEVRDVLLAVIYEWQYSQEQNEEFPTLTEAVTPSPDETLTRLQQIGGRLIVQLPNLSRWIGRLQTARNPDRIRGAYLNAVQRDAMSFVDFVFLAPLGDSQRLWLLRDYLLAYLFDKAPEALSAEEEQVVVGVEDSLSEN
jgi:CRISPR-associated protein Cst1